MILLLLLLSFSAQAAWVESNGVGTWFPTNEWNTNGAYGGWFNNYAAPQYTVPRETWKEVWVSDVGIPPDARQVQVTGILIVTHGNTEETCDLHLVVQQPDYINQPVGKYNYISQVVATEGGVRSPFAFSIPVVDGRFLWGWTGSTPGTWPDHCSYGMMMYIQGYVR